MTFVALVLIVDSACAAAGDRSDRSARSTACDCANRSATGRADAYSLDGSANVMPPMIPVINHIADYRIMS